MPITFHDRAPLEKVRRLTDGRIAAVAKFARSGVYHYAGAEVGRPDLTDVAVYRPEAEVFDEATMASFTHKAITLGHPAGAVTADNWQKHSVGWTEGKVARDGEFVEIPLMLADASAVKAYESGEARELSAGYECELIWGDGVAPSGERFSATQTRIRGNHIAQVAAGRAGSACRIGDAAAGSIDARLKAHIAESAKAAGLKPSAWLAQQTDRDMKSLIESVATAVVGEASAAGIAGAFNMDKLADAAVAAQVDREQAEHVAKFSFMGDQAPAFDAERAEFLARQHVAAMPARAARDAIRQGTGGAFAASVPTSASAADNSGSGAAVRDAARLARYQ